VFEDSSISLNPNQGSYVTPCMENIKRVSRKGNKKQRREAK
jgi:hypothetical protein